MKKFGAIAYCLRGMANFYRLAHALDDGITESRTGDEG